MRQRYIEIVTAASMGGVPGSMIRRYTANADRLNQLLAQNVKLYREVGGKSVPPTFIPGIVARRAYQDAEVLTIADLDIYPCPEPSAELGWVPIAIGLVKVAIIAGSAIWTAHEVRQIWTAKYYAQAKAAIAQIKIQELATIQQEQVHGAFSQQMTICMKGATDRTDYERCANAVAPWLATFQKNLPEYKPPTSKSDMGFFGWLGIAVFFMALGTTGYVWWNWRQRKKLMAAHAEGEKAQARASLSPSVDEEEAL